MSDHPARAPDAPVESLFIERWSPRAFSSEPVAPDMLATLFEAARWAPSSFNEQPWLFLYARSEPDLTRFRSLLTDRNRRWADRAPVLAFAFARRAWRKTGAPNRHASFDTGSAWMSLTLQARMLDLYTHAMAGFDVESSYATLGVPEEEYEAIAAISIGWYGDPSTLPEDLQARERPSPRKPLAEVAIEGRFSGRL